MTTSYVKPCIYCKKEIEMSDRAAGQWLPYNSDGSIHDCRNTGTKNGSNNGKTEDKPRKPIEEVTALVAIFNKLHEIDEKVNLLVGRISK